MPGDEIEDRQVRYGGQLPGVVELDLGDGLEAAAPCQSPVRGGTWSGAGGRKAYSPIAVFTPPRTMGSDHSLTDISQTSRGRRAIGPASGQHQSHTMTFSPRRRLMDPLLDRGIDLGHDLGRLAATASRAAVLLAMRAQFVRFSDAVMVKTPPSPGTSRNT